MTLTILLLTSSSMALTNSAALGVSELEGRTERRDDACGERMRGKWVRRHLGKEKKYSGGKKKGHTFYFIPLSCMFLHQLIYLINFGFIVL